MQKAKSIAVNLGFQTDPIPTNITENSTAPIPYQQPYPIRGEIAATPIEPGNKQIEATVTVDFVNIGRFNTEPY
jgi:uncharacterized protein YggE